MKSAPAGRSLCGTRCPAGPCPQPRGPAEAKNILQQQRSCSPSGLPAELCAQAVQQPCLQLSQTQHRGCSPALRTTETKQINPNWPRPLPLSGKRSLCTGSPCSRYLPTAPSEPWRDVADPHFQAVVYHQTRQDFGAKFRQQKCILSCFLLLCKDTSQEQISISQ